MTTSHFFERGSTASGELQLIFNGLRLPPADWIKLLQTVVMKKGAMHADSMYQSILDKARGILPKWAMTGMQQVLDPPFSKLREFFALLLVMDTGAPQERVDWDILENKLLDLEQTVHTLFTKYAWTITALRPLLVPLLQGYLADKRTQKQLAESFKVYSIRPLLYQMLFNEYEEFGVTTPEKVIEPESLLNISEERELGLILQKLMQLEHTALSTTSDVFPYLRGLAYLHILRTETVYFPRLDAPNTEQASSLADISIEDLPKLIQQIIQKNSHLDERTNIQLLAILDTLYHRLGQSFLSTQDLASILLAVNQSKFALQWQLDAQKISSHVLLIYIALLCIRGDVVHIEQVERLLGLDKDYSLNFLQILGIKLTISPSKLGLLQANQLNSNPQTFYFGSQIICFSTHVTVNNYVAQALVEIKQQLFQILDAWDSVLKANHIDSSILQVQSEALMRDLEKSWVTHLQRQQSYANLEAMDYHIEAFHQQQLQEIWNKIDQSLVCAAQNLSTAVQQEIASFHQKSLVWCNALSCRQYARYQVVLSALKVDDAVIQQYIAYTRLYYEQSYFSESEQIHWLNHYLRGHTQNLRRLCPGIAQGVTPADQLKLVIEGLAQSKNKDRHSAETTAASTLVVALYHILNKLLPWFAETRIQTQIEQLTRVTASTALQSVAQNLMLQLNWPNQPHSFYYRWFESDAVIHTAKIVYEAAEQVHHHPTDTFNLKVLLQTLLEQQQVLAQQSSYIPWAWLFGYPNTQEVVSSAIQKLSTMIALHQIPAILPEAQETVHCKLILQHLTSLDSSLIIEPAKRQDWQRVIQRLQAEAMPINYASLYELYDYLETQRHQFAFKRQSYFYGPRTYDPIDLLLQALEKEFLAIGKYPQSWLMSRDFLLKKSRDIQAQHPGLTNVTIQAGYYEQPYFDLWIESPEPIVGLKADTRHPNLWFKRFYQAKDLFVFARELRFFCDQTDHLAIDPNR